MAQPTAQVGSPFLWLLSFGEAKESYSRRKRETPAKTKQHHQHLANKHSTNNQQKPHPMDTQQLKTYFTT
ncbi:MAG: hypothetical protein LWW81_12745, partial [Rhodocyclales bacterium]|nr:hypothetical protein [Rhodocyclales bacterium]